jgi:hypothetical protein
MKHLFARTPDATQRLRRLFGLFILLLGALQARAQQRQVPLFVENAEAQTAAAASPLRTALRQARPLMLNVPALAATLASAPAETLAGATPVQLTLPLPDGRSARFAVVEASVMEPGLAAQFPTINTYRGWGLDDPTATVRLDLTPLGFHAQILTPGQSPVYIDPLSLTDTRHYLSFYRRDMNPGALGSRPACGVSDDMVRPRAGGPLRRPAMPQGVGATLRTYRLAVAATGEYTAAKGGTVAAGQAGIVTTVNRVVGVYETELAVRMVLVNGNSSLVYTDAATDPYTPNDQQALLRQNQATVDAVIGNANYDIGHVFTTSGGGLAFVGIVCEANFTIDGQTYGKAGGETGLPNPSGDAFAIDYVAHEMGHQFGANHTFNSGGTTNCSDDATTGTRNADTAYEPGSGSTIMAYAGVCAPDNIQNNSDPYFHVVSFEEIQAYLAFTSCASTAATGNTPPVVSALPPSKVLPIGTPFKLTATATDANGDALTYSWEEYDLGPAGSPIAPQVANQTNPLFRSFPPSSSPTRYFPRLSDVVANTSNVGERLPIVSRALSFRVTVRDQHNGSQGVVGGIRSSSVVALSSNSAAGPFLVTAPNTALTWTGNSTQTVTWSVAGTSANGVNCATVNIRLSTDGGFTYPTLLLAGTANDGAAPVAVPNVATTQARVLVEAADNYFFDISNTNFTITPAACTAPTSLSVGSITATTATVSFTASGSATDYTVTTTPASTSQTVATSPASLGGLTPGTAYTVNIVSNCSGGATSTAATASFTTAAATTTTTLTSSVNPSTFGQSVTLTATLSPTAATGSVTFFDGSTSLGTSTLSAGVATLSTSALAVGSHSLTAVYGGSASYAGSTSAALTQTVNPAPPVITGLNPTSGPVGTAVVISGSNLTGVTGISFNGTAATFTTNSATAVTATVPAGATTGAVTVTTAGGTSNGLSFTVTPGDLTVTNNVITPASTYRNVTITGTGRLLLNGPLTVTGTLLVQNGGQFITNCYATSGSGSLVLEAGASLSICDPAGLSASGAIQLSGTRSFSTDANYLYNGTAAQVTGAGLPATVRNLTLNNPAGVTLSADVSIREALAPAAGTFSTAGRVLTLLSTATSTAYVAYTRPTAGSISGPVTVQRYVDGSLNAGPGYRHFSAPVTNTSFADLAAGGFVPVVNPVYNSTAQPGLTTPYPTVFGYNQSRVATATNDLSGFDKGWFSPAAPTDNMSSGQGYTVHAPAGITVDFVGTPAQTDLSKSGLGRGPDPDAGWHLLGNPYPAPLHWDSLRTHGGLTGLDNALYVFKSSGEYAGSYASYVNGVGTNNGGPVLPLGQGFFVRTTTVGSSGQLTFHNTDRLNTSLAPAFQRGAPDTRPLLRLALSGPASAGTDETVVYFEDGATASGPDDAFDAPKLANPGARLSLASQLVANEPLAINGLPLTGAPLASIPLMLRVPATGPYHFDVRELRGFPANAPATLLDHATGTRTDLRLTPAYAFSTAQAGALNGRFELLLGRPGSLTATAGASALQVSVWPNPAAHKATLHVQLAQAASATVTLRDVLGRELLQQRFSGTGTELSTTRLAAGTYLLTVQVPGQAPATRRVVVE